MRILTIFIAIFILIFSTVLAVDLIDEDKEPVPEPIAEPEPHPEPVPEPEPKPGDPIPKSKEITKDHFTAPSITFNNINSEDYGDMVGEQVKKIFFSCF